MVKITNTLEAPKRMDMEYIDSRGATMPHMSFVEALELVHNLADSNQLDEDHVDNGDTALESVRQWQQQALDTVHDLFSNHGDRLDELEASEEAREWAAEVWSTKPEMDASVPSNAIRICLELAEQAALDPDDCGRDIDLAEECDRQQQAFDVVRDLLGMHGQELSQIQSSNPTPNQ